LKTPDIGSSPLGPQTLRRGIKTHQLNPDDPHAGIERHISPGATRHVQRIDRVRDHGQPWT